MEIQELHNSTQSQFEDLKQLMSELSDRVKFTQTDLMLVLKNSNCHLYVIFDDERIVGCATLCVFHSPTGTKASVEDVVVSSAYRGQHLGKQLMEYVLEQAKAYAPIELHLTSNPKRVAANKLYQSIGFQKKETNCYQMIISEHALETSDLDSLKQNITYLIGKERAEGNLEPPTPEYVSRMLNVPQNEVEKCMKEMGL
ncbi:MAG: GNAT family N-acetyltransferase [Segatella copri]